MHRIKTYLGTLMSWGILPQLICTLVPAVILTIYWFGIDVALTMALILGPVVYVTGKPSFRKTMSEGSDFHNRLNQIIANVKNTNLKSALVLLSIDDNKDLKSSVTTDVYQMLNAEIFDRLNSMMRDHDHLFSISDGRFAVTLGPVKNLQTDQILTIIKRLQMVLNEPCTAALNQHYITLSAGYKAIEGAIKVTELVEDVKTAVWYAGIHGPSAIRAYTDQLKAPPKTSTQSSEIQKALNSHEIIPWFQPQISLETGDIIGVEALARWDHPTRGILPPGVFLDQIEENQDLIQLGDIIRQETFRALQNWHRGGYMVPTAGINFSTQELSDPRLIQKIEWQLDQFNLKPNHLTVEILETVIADAPDDIISMNINGLANFGCPIDLDDFGTGHASITSLRSFPVNRLKIDRSFVSHLSKDASQAKLIKAIMSLAADLDMETLAEGIETQSDYDSLLKLGCKFGQGYGIAKPMSYADMFKFLKKQYGSQRSPRIAGA